MVFSRNFNDHVQREIMDLWKVSSVQQHEKHLGLPPMVGKSKTRGFFEIKHKI